MIFLIINFAILCTLQKRAFQTVSTVKKQDLPGLILILFSQKSGKNKIFKTDLKVRLYVLFLIFQFLHFSLLDEKCTFWFFHIAKKTPLKWPFWKSHFYGRSSLRCSFFMQKNVKKLIICMPYFFRESIDLGIFLTPFSS